MKSLLEQLKERRTALGLKQKDMMLRVGMLRQQYQQLESKGNPRLDTLELLAKGLKSNLMLIPREKLNAVKAILEGEGVTLGLSAKESAGEDEENALVNDPWKDILGDGK